MTHPAIQEILISPERLQVRVAELAQEIAKEYQGKTPFLIGILRGSVPFIGDFMKAYPGLVEVDYMAVSSYHGATTTSSGSVRFIKDLEENIEGRDVIILEDIIDTGMTLSYLVRILKERRPASLKICTLLDKPSRRKSELFADYVGFEVPDAFVVGYGLDFNQLYRNLPFIGVLKPEMYQDS